uniref:Uncharacterized protein n=1 Tax=Parastrongyloides trichosuri TaxID=131310 RepID=A0A0N4ZMZ3_PARTI
MLSLLTSLPIEGHKIFNLKISTILLLTISLTLITTIYADDSEMGIEDTLAIRFHRAKELTPPSYMKRNYIDNYQQPQQKHQEMNDFDINDIYLQEICSQNDFYHPFCRLFLIKL